MLWIIFGIAMAVMWTNMSRHGRRRHGLDATTGQRLAALEAELVSRDDTIGLLEARVAELENRLDFTERLLSDGRSA